VPYPVTYYCPRCDAVHELEREGYLADKTVTPYPLEGWRYADPDDPYGEAEDIDGVRIVCGDPDLLLTGEDLPSASVAPDEGCGEPFYLSFVRFEDGKEVEPKRESEEVTLGVGPSGPSGPGGPTGPSGGTGEE
jgi:hypothetical protein